MTSLPEEEAQDEYIDDTEGDSGFEPISLILPREAAGERLDKTLSQLVPQYSRSRMKQWIDAGLVTMEGEPARAKAIVTGGESIVIAPQASPEETAFAPEPITLHILHEDAAIVVLDKPAGLVVHPAAGNWSGTLLNGLLHHLPAIAGVPRAGIVHRLDKDTSGLMVVAKTLEAQTDLVRQLQARTVKREYLALLWGNAPLSGKIDKALARHPRDRIKMAVSGNASAKPAVTHFLKLKSGAIEGRAVSLVRCMLETGRTHQIRVHMQSLGFPLVGDPLYGKPHLAGVFPRQALHAQRLGLIHPQSRQACEWSAALPSDMRELLALAGITDESTA